MTGEPSAYKWARSRFKSDPNVAAKIINDIRANHDGFCPPRELVNAAKHPSSPIHEDIYGKDDNEAAYEYRLQIARHMVRALEPVVMTVPYEQAFLNIRIQRGDEVIQGYVATEEVMQNIEYRAYAVGEAKKALSALRRRYAWIKELSEVWEVIDVSTAEEEAEAV